MEPESSLPHSQVAATCPYPEPARCSPSPHPTSWRSILILSSHLSLGLPSGLFPSFLFPLIRRHYKRRAPSPRPSGRFIRSSPKKKCTERHLYLQTVGVTLRHLTVILTQVCKRLTLKKHTSCRTCVNSYLCCGLRLCTFSTCGKAKVATPCWVHEPSLFLEQ